MADEIVVRPARARADYDACVLLQRAVWGLEDSEIPESVILASINDIETERGTPSVACRSRVDAVARRFYRAL